MPLHFCLGSLFNESIEYLLSSKLDLLLLEQLIRTEYLAAVYYASPNIFCQSVFLVSTQNPRDSVVLVSTSGCLSSSQGMQTIDACCYELEASFL